MVVKFEHKSTEKNVKKERIGGYYGKKSVMLQTCIIIGIKGVQPKKRRHRNTRTYV